jgi:hypothetical protein
MDGRVAWVAVFAWLTSIAWSRGLLLPTLGHFTPLVRHSNAQRSPVNGETVDAGALAGEQVMARHC